MGAPSVVTRSRLVSDLRSLGVQAGATVMVHTRMSALGWVVGGTQTVVEALLETLGPTGTLLAYAGWEDDPWHLAEWDDGRQRAYLAELPPFDPVLSAADPDFGRIPERLRTWPGAQLSDAHVFRMVAVGPGAPALTRDAPWDFPSGAGSPLARLVGAGGSVLLLGAPMDALTLIHHAESSTALPARREVRYRIPVRRQGQVEWREVRDIDSSARGAFAYDDLDLGEDAFAVIGREALARGAGVAGPVGDSTSHLYDAGSLVGVAVDWLTERFGEAG